MVSNACWKSQLVVVRDFLRAFGVQLVPIPEIEFP
jgi:hypothetical protein